MIKTLEEQRLDAFEDWLSQIHSTWNEALDKKFSASTINSYRSHIATLNSRLIEHELVKDLYAEEDPEIGWQHYQDLLQIPSIATEKTRKGKDIQAGVEKYFDFLRYQRDFDWIPFFQELAEKLSDYENRQSDLMNVLRTADVDVGTKDRVEGEMVDLMEIDPFSFFGLCLKYRKKDKRRAIFTKLKDYFELTAAVPSTYNGVPNSNPQQVWLFAYQHERKPEDIPLLWNLYKMAINKEISNQVFKKALDIKKVGTSKLTQSLFYLDPFTYLPINAQTIPYLESRGVSCEFDSWEGYQNILKQVVAEIKRPFYEVSYDAWLENKKDKAPPLVSDLRVLIDQDQEGLEERFKTYLKGFSRSNVEFYFAQSKVLLSRIPLALKDQRISYVPYGDRLHISIGNRYCLLMDQRPKAKKWGFITDQKIDDRQATLGYDYQGGPDSFFYETEKGDLLIQYADLTVAALTNELERIEKSALIKHHNPFFEKAIFDRSYRNHILNEVFGPKKRQQTMPSLNQILYGPPGTGKTYQTKALAVKILTEEVFDDRPDTNKRYYQLFDQGRIKFVTFHQSTSYEDFVEGIKPIMENEEEEIGNLSYSIKEGIFKQMCVEAAYEYIKQQQPGEAAAKALTFGQLYENLFNRYQEQLDEDEEIKIPLKAGNEVSVINLSSQGNFILQHKDGQRSYTVSKARLEKLYNAIDDFETIPNIYTYFRSIIGGSNASAYWAILNQIVQLELPQGIPTVPNAVSYGDKQKAFERIDWQSIDTNIDVPAYVLIIDEINRGNIASILGELITLLEEDKRGGQKEGLEVMLPYSKSNFSVPPNLYIIGTMNTADRSVEALDTALRRRFSFTEIAPDPSLLKELIVEGIELETLLRTINKRIEKLLDKDHMIGHGDLIQLKDGENKISRLKHVFQHKISPLLQEYFYGNLGKIQLILGSAFVALEPEDNAITFAKNIDYEGDEYLDRSIYRIENVEEMHDEAFIQAVKAIYS